MAKIEQKHLEGLIFGTNEAKEITDNGMKKTRYFPASRPLTVDDLIAQQDNGNTFHIVAADGRKYDVPKAVPKSAKTGGDENEAK